MVGDSCALDTKISKCVYILNSLKILWLTLPYMGVVLVYVIGDAIDRTFANSCGTAAIVAFGTFYSIEGIFLTLSRVINSVYTVLIAREKDLNKESISSINSSAILLDVLTSLCIVLGLVLCHGALARFFTTDKVTEEILSSLFLMFTLVLFMRCLTDIIDTYMVATRQNTKLFVLYAIYYAMLALSDWFILYLGFGAVYVYLATVGNMAVYSVAIMFVSGFRFGKPKLSIMKEIVLLGVPLLMDRLCQRVTTIVQVKVATLLPAETYVLYILVFSVYLWFEELIYGGGDGWNVYVCEFLSGAREKMSSVYNKSINLLKQADTLAVVGLVFTALVYALTVYPIWYFYGSAVTWDTFLPNMSVFMLLFVTYIPYLLYFNMLKAYKKTKCLTKVALLGGICTRIPILLVGVCLLKGGILTIVFAITTDYVVRDLYLRHQLLKG